MKKLILTIHGDEFSREGSEDELLQVARRVSKHIASNCKKVPKEPVWMLKLSGSWWDIWKLEVR